MFSQTKQMAKSGPPHQNTQQSADFVDIVPITDDGERQEDLRHWAALHVEHVYRGTPVTPAVANQQTKT